MAGDYAWLGIVIVVGSMISLVYYLRVVAVMWMGRVEVELPTLPPRRVKAVGGWSPEADARAQPEVLVGGGAGRRGDDLLRRLARAAVRRGPRRGHIALEPAVSEFIHTCYRIGDIDRAVDFYEKLGFEERRRMDLPDGAINVFMGMPGDGDRLELTWNPGVDSYDLGTGYNHIALVVDGLDDTLSSWRPAASSRRSRPTTSASTARGSASCATRTATGSS